MPSLPGPLRSPKNLIALGVGFFVAIVFWLVSSSDSSHLSIQKQQPELVRSEPNELDRMEHAIRLARAWHVISTGRLGNELFQTEEDVVCPSDTHTITRSLTANGPGEVTEEFITTANMIYEREAGEPWRSQPDPDPDTDKCKNGPSAGSQKLLTMLTPIKHAVRVSEGPVIKLGSGSCRLWDLSGASNLPFHSICVEDDTHLPRRLQLGGLLVEYSNWNQPTIIEPPEMPSSHPVP
jgi:hypothetical protein